MFVKNEIVIDVRSVALHPHILSLLLFHPLARLLSFSFCFLSRSKHPNGIANYSAENKMLLFLWTKKQKCGKNEIIPTERNVVACFCDMI